jgi:hypothetical protein
MTMTPDDVSEMTLEALRAAREAMMSAEWSLEMDAATPDIRRRSGLLLGMVQGEILRLENAQLDALAAALAANAAALESASRDVKREVRRIAQVAKVLKAVDDLVKLAIKIVPKAAGLMGAARRAPAAAKRPERKPKTKSKAKAKVKTKVNGAGRRVAAPKRKSAPRRGGR